MPPISVGEDVDVVPHHRLDVFGAGEPEVVADVQLVLQRTEEALGGRVVMALPRAAEAASSTYSIQVGLEGVAHKLAATIAVKQQPARELAQRQGLGQRSAGEFGIRCEPTVQPTTRRLNRSRIATRNAGPSSVSR